MKKNIYLNLFLSFIFFAGFSPDALRAEEPGAGSPSSSPPSSLDAQPPKEGGGGASPGRFFESRWSGEEPLFSLRPGIVAHYATATLDDRTEEADVGNRARMLPDDEILGWSLDLSVSGWKITERFGINLVWNASSYRFTRQIIDNSADPVRESDSSTFPGRDIGTRLKGYYTYFAVGGFFDYNRFRIGGGVGPGYISGEGVVDFKVGQTDPMLYKVLSNPNTQMQDYVFYRMSTGEINPKALDPISGYLLLHIEESINLERLGLYWLTDGSIAPNPREILVLSSIYPNISPLALLAARSLSMRRVALNDPMLSLFFYVDFPALFGFLKPAVRLDVLTSAGTEKNFNVANMAFSLSVPLDFRLRYRDAISLRKE